VRAELDRTYVSAVERGRQNLTLGAIMKLAGALETSLDDLLGLKRS
jgi:transcriptional regulator with XRE-family HTH domain